MNITKIFFVLILLITIFSCENIVAYEGIVVDSDNDSILSDVKVLVIQNNTIQDNYGIEILDTIPMAKRDRLRKLNVKDNFSKVTYDTRGFYFRNEPIKSDSLGRFYVWLHEGCIFGCPDYEIKFEKDGYEDFKLKGDWKSNDSLKIKLKSI